MSEIKKGPPTGEVATEPPRDEEAVYYVGVGASAGGLEALQDFFRTMPDDTGMAFIVIQHLSPDYKSLMDELLARHTQMPISIVSDGVTVEPNHVYLIPPRKNLSVFHGKLYLEDQDARKGLNLPIDIFFRSLASDKGKHAIGIILSGTGSDGTLGIRALKEAGGMIMVQDERTAKFDGMPRSSISTGIVDYVLPPARMGEELMNYIKHPFVRKREGMGSVIPENLDTLTKIILTLREHSGVDFSYYRENTVVRRLERRMSINRFDNLEEYLNFLQQSHKEKDVLYREMLIGVTRFFRDQEAFQSISDSVLREMLKEKKSIRIWSVGCSTGEEVYSLAMLIMEFMRENNIECEVKVFATDIDRQALDTAGQGFYPDSILADVDPILLNRYFVRRDEGYQVNELIRKMVVFATHNLLKDPPFSKLDLIVCRNLFIYFKPEVQQKVLAMFYYSLSPDGFLFMGSSESIGDMIEGFQVVDGKWKIYRYRPGYNPPMGPLPLARFRQTESESLHTMRPRVIGARMDRLMEGAMARFLPPTVIVDRQDNIVHVINDVTLFLAVKPGRFSTSLLASVTDELAPFVSNLLRRLKKDTKDMTLANVAGIKSLEGQTLDIEGRVVEVDQVPFYLISFVLSSGQRPPKERAQINIDMEMEISNRVAELERELQVAKESLQATVEELETSNEELQSSNEELIASNEELQSTNEELQSVNEELYTVNSEYQLKIDELTRVNNDLDNLLKNTEVGALYLDMNLCIRKITPIVTKITNILPGDIGRPLSHISVRPPYKDMLNDVEKVIDNLQSIEKEVQDSQGNTWFTRIRPYRSSFNAVEGIILTFVDMSKLKREQRRTEDLSNRFAQARDIANLAWWEWDVRTGQVIHDDKKATMLGYDPEEFPVDVYDIRDLIHPQDYDDTMQIMREHLEGKTEFWDATYRIQRKDGSYAWYYDRGVVTERDRSGKPSKVVGTVLDVSTLKGLEMELCQSREVFEKMLEFSPIAKTMVDVSGQITYANKRAEELFGITKKEILDRTYDASKWQISAVGGGPVKSEDLPFAVIKRTLQPVVAFQHYIQVPLRDKVLLSISGVPLLDKDGRFEGAVFTLDMAKAVEDDE